MSYRALSMALLFLSLGGCLAHRGAHLQPSPMNNATPLPEGFAYPNGIAAAPDGTLYVGSVTAGTLLRIAPGERPQVMFEGNHELFAGTALKFDPQTNLLWVSSPDFLGKLVDGKRVRRSHRVAVVDPERGAVVWSAPVPDGGFVNDITLDGRGGVYLTDTTLDQVWHLAGPNKTFRLHVKSPLFRPGTLGPAGIVMLDDRSLIIGLYDEGELLKVTPQGAVSTLATERRLTNPDGLAVTPGGWLLVIEGAVDSGNGRLVAVDLKAATPHPVRVLMEGLDTPVNLALVGDDVVVTESRIRHLMRPERSLPAPASWRLVRRRLPPGHRQPRTEVAAQLPESFFPESITMDSRGRSYLGSATRAEILRVSPGGRVESWIPAGTNGLMSVQGLLFDPRRQRIYACTGDLKKHKTPTTTSALLAFDVVNGQLSGRWALDGKGFCNDMVSLPDGSLLITDTFRGRLWRFDPAAAGAMEVWLDAPSLRGANGIAVTPSGSTIYVSTFTRGQLLSVGRAPDGTPGLVTVLKASRALDGGDALRVTRDGRLVVFENGLVAGQGRISIGVVDRGNLRLSTLVKTSAGPVSGVVDGDRVLWPASNFQRLFKDDSGLPYDRALYRTPLPN